MGSGRSTIGPAFAWSSPLKKTNLNGLLTQGQARTFFQVILLNNLEHYDDQYYLFKSDQYIPFDTVNEVE